MGFYPDIVVSERDWHRKRLVVGVDDETDDLAARAADIKAYMDKSNIQEGLLISPTHFRIYRNDYRPAPEDSVTEVADFPTEQVMGQLPSQTEGREFALFVQRWLEWLKVEFLNGNVALSPDVQKVVKWEIMPELYDDVEIWAAGSRWSRVAS